MDKDCCSLTRSLLFLRSYIIRDLTEEEKETKVSKDVKKLRNFEEGMLKHYQNFLQVLENILQDFRRVRRLDNKQIKQGEFHLAPEVHDAEKLAIIANKCMCDLLLRSPAFNFAKNLMASIVPRMCLQQPEEVGHLFSSNRSTFR